MMIASSPTPAPEGLIILLQSNIARDVDTTLPPDSPHKVVRFSIKDGWIQDLKRLDAEVRDASRRNGTGPRVLCLVSLQAARLIRWRFPTLATGLILEPERLALHAVSGLMPQEWLLNRSFILLPLGAIIARKDQIRSLFGDKVFIRPNSAMKEFAGDVINTDDLELEINARRQIGSLHGNQLCAIDRAQNISCDEYRFWILSGKIITSAGYNHRLETAAPCPIEITALAEDVARHAEPIIDPVVADFVMDSDGVPRLIEMNAMSTSGFYQGMEFAKLVDAMSEVFI